MWEFDLNLNFLLSYFLFFLSFLVEEIARVDDSERRGRTGRREKFGTLTSPALQHSLAGLVGSVKCAETDRLRVDNGYACAGRRSFFFL